MMRSRSFRVQASLLLCLFLVSCVTTQLPPISNSGGSFEPEKDERRLWEMSREEESKLRENVTIYRDPLLTDYLEGVVSGLNPPGMAANPSISYRVTVIEDPTLNAFAYPTGSLYFHTGLLARMENEDQLATVVGHEMTHVENRHMLRFQRSVRNKQIGFTVAAIGAAVILAGEQGHAAREGHYGKAARIGVLGDIMLSLGLTLALVAAVNGYGRDLEREADSGGFEKMLDAGYDIRESPKVYRALLDDHGESGKVEAFFFGSHPQLTERIETAEHQASAYTPPATSSPSGKDIDFLRRMRPVIRADARLNIELGRLLLAQDELVKVLEILPEDPVAHFLRGRLRLHKADAAKDPLEKENLQNAAMISFREAIRLDPQLPGPHREAGLLNYREGDFQSACAHFKSYLELDPKADDAQSIRDYVLELKRDGHCR